MIENMKYKLIDSVRNGEWVFCSPNGLAVRADAKGSAEILKSMENNPSSYCKVETVLYAGDLFENEKGKICNIVRGEV